MRTFRGMRSIIFTGEIQRSFDVLRRHYIASKKKITMQKETYLAQHHHHKTWLNYLAFYRDEMQIFQKRLEEVAAKNTGQEAAASIEHFQNQLILHKEQHDILRHDIKQYENRIEAAYENNPVLAENSRLEEETELAERVATFSRLFQEMKDEFYHFVARHL